MGYLAQISPWGIDRFAFGAPTGPFGLVSSRQGYARDVWDDRPDGTVYPLYHVACWLSAAAGGRVVSAGIDGHLAHLTWEKTGRRETLLANLSANPVTVDLPDRPTITGSLLDEDSFEVATADRAVFSTSRALAGPVRIGGYGVLHLKHGDNQ